MSSMSTSVGGSLGELEGASLEGDIAQGGGRARWTGHLPKGAEWLPSQWGHFTGEVRQQLRIECRFPPPGQEGLGQRCSFSEWWRDQRGQTECGVRHRSLTRPNS